MMTTGAPWGGCWSNCSPNRSTQKVATFLLMKEKGGFVMGKEVLNYHSLRIDIGNRIARVEMNFLALAIYL